MELDESYAHYDILYLWQLEISEGNYAVIAYQ